MTLKSYPAIAIAGIGQSIVRNTENGKRVWPIDIDTKKLVGKIVLPFIGSVITRCDAGLSKAVYKEFSRQIDGLALDEDGNEIHALEVERYKNSFKECSEKERRYIKRMLPVDKIAAEIGEENFYFFTYNSFGNTEKVVAELDEFIENVMKQRNADKVNLVPVSLGGTISTAYVNKHGHRGHINRVVGVVPAYDGSSLAIGLIDGSFSEFEEDIIPKELKKLTSLLTKKTRGNIVDSIFNALRDKVLSRSSVGWGAIPHGDYERLCAKHKRSPNLERICEENYAIRRDFLAFIAKQKENGIEFFSLCGYGLPMEKMFRRDNSHSDGIVDTASCSMGAECSDLEKDIDVSTSAIKDRVWFYKSMDHEGAAKTDHLLKLCGLLLKDNSITSVYDNENFKQFN
ncbi:MAG: hypothetical protein IJF20_06285 [Clostridia bacterium]|nr:hypothetical protein [Clostridia bacterium]